MRVVQLKTLGERLFGKKSKAKCKNKVKNTVLALPSNRKLNLDLGVDEQPYKKSKIEVEKQRVVKDSKANVVASLPETTQPAQSAPVTNLKKALIAARAAMMKKAIPGKVQQDAKGQIECCKRNVDEYDQLLELCGCRLSYDSHIGVVLRLREVKTMKVVDPLASIGLKLKKQFVAGPSDYDDYSADVDLEEVEARCIEERKGRAALEISVDEDNKMLAYDQLLVLCGCSLSYDSHILRLREFKTWKLLDPLASIGLKLKKQFVTDATDYADYHVDMDLEEGELEEGEILE